MGHLIKIFDMFLSHCLRYAALCSIYAFIQNFTRSSRHWQYRKMLSMPGHRSDRQLLDPVDNVNALLGQTL